MFEGNTTHESNDQDSDCLNYSVSFELYPFSESHEYSLYHGRLNGPEDAKESKHGKYCVVRTLTASHPRLRHWAPFLACHKQAGFLAKEFNQLIMNGDVVFFAKPLRAAMDSVWKWKSVIGRLLVRWKPHRKRLAEGEIVILEEYFKRSNTFISSEGFVGPSECDVLQAFGHFTWTFTRGQMVVTDLKGVRKDDQYFLTDPTIHSVAMETVEGSPAEKKYGDKDKGQVGMSSFFHCHRCNGLCRGFPLPYAA